jgi:hypothetical protein
VNHDGSIQRRLAVRATRDHRHAPPLPGGVAVVLRVVTLVAERCPRRGIEAVVEQNFELRAVRGLGAGQVEVEWQPIEIALDVDFRAEPAAGSAKRLIAAPLFAPAETWARAVVLSNIWITAAVWLQPASARKNASNVPLRDSRENRFQTLFQLPNLSGNSRQVMLCSVT